MKIRIISALVGIVVLVGVLLCPYTLVLAIAAAALSAVAVWELLYNTGKAKKVTAIGSMVLSAAMVLFLYNARLVYTATNFNVRNELYVKAFLCVVLLVFLAGIFHLLMWVITRKSISVNAACYSFLMTLYPSAGFGSLVMLREVPHLGIWLLVLLLILAWVSDTGAYFVGTFLGKHKMAPKISPKKSWEGFFGGWIIAVGVAVLLFVIRFEVPGHNFRQGLFTSLVMYLPVAVVLTPLSVVGDLLASVIKRRVGIKDFGNVMPGHGGVMDRFDSVIFIAPILYWVATNTQTLVNLYYNTIGSLFGA